MVTTMDSAGRIVLPRSVREEARLKPGAPLEIRFRDGIVEIEPAPLAVKLQRRGRFWVAVPEAPTARLTEHEVRGTRRRLRERRTA